VRTTLPVSRREATTRSGAAPFSTQPTSGVIVSTSSGPTPPAQWNTPGSMKSRKKSGVCAPIVSRTRS
jgi:hypothetical protein